MENGRSRPSWSLANSDSPFRTAILVCLVATLAYLTAMLGGSLLLHPSMVSPLWPGCALLVSVLLFAQRKIWPILIAAGFASFVLHDLQTGWPIRSIVLIILADAAEVITAAFCLSYSFHAVPRLNSLRSLTKYSFFAVVLAPFAGALVGAVAGADSYWTNWRIYFFSEALAYLTLLPAILGWADKRSAWAEKSRAYFLEAAALLAAVALFGYLTLVAPERSSLPAALYSLMPLLLWSALRFGSTGVSTSMILIAFLSIWGATRGRGPFIESGPLNNVLSLQFFLLLTTVPFMVLAVIVEERKRAEEWLAELSGRLITAQDEERSRIARELHDDFSQRLALQGIGLAQLWKKIPESEVAERAKVQELLKGIQEISSDMRSLSHELHSSRLDLVGLAPALMGLCEELSSRSKIQIAFTEHAVSPGIPKDVALCLFRIAQEALGNVIKHSGAKQAKAELYGTQNEIRLRVVDAGFGFDQALRNGGAGLGLVSMRERLRLIGGKLSVQSAPMRGTEILAEVPFLPFPDAQATKPR
jgi:signal transduction histidine kinase